MSSPIHAALACLLLSHPAETPAEPPVIESVRGVTYVDGTPDDPEKQKLDLFFPKDVHDFPVVLFVHGGAWTSGDRKVYSTLGATLARNGVGAVLISYRLTPAVTHPAHIQDVASAFAWTKRHIAEYGGDPGRIFVTGQSAGGHLAALLATNDKYLAAHGLSARDIRGCIPISGIYTFGDARSRRLFGDDPGAPADASPVLHVSGDEPPFLILYASSDFPGCRLMSLDLAAALRDQHVPAETLEIPGRNHISIILRAMLSDADPTTRALLDFVRDHSQPDPTPNAAP